MPRPTTGFFYRRPIDGQSEAAARRRGMLYWAWNDQRCRKVLCCYTTSAKVAAERVKRFGLPFALHPPSVARANIMGAARAAAAILDESIAARAAKISTPWCNPHDVGGHFRRIRSVGRRHVYEPIDGDPLAVIYWQGKVDGIRVEYCVHTTDRQEAARRVGIFGPTFQLTDFEKFCRALMRMAEHVEMEHPNRGVPLPMGTKRRGNAGKPSRAASGTRRARA